MRLRMVVLVERNRGGVCACVRVRERELLSVFCADHMIWCISFLFSLPAKGF